MTLNTKSLLKPLVARLSLMVVAACFCLNAMAQNWVTMDNFSIKLGETKACRQTI